MEGENKTSKREKLNSAVVLVVCVFALFFGYYQLASNINNPFAFLVKANSTSNSAQVDSQQATIDVLKAQDTDSDGLSDYDEVYVYKTSPYLADSDGDGILDGQEVKQGTNPNCPEGKQCFGVGLSTATSSAGSVPTFEANPPAQSAPQITIAGIRTALVQGGMSQADVTAMSDNDVLSIYQQVLADNPDLATQINSNNVSAPVAPPISSVASTTATGTVGTFSPSKTIDTAGLNIGSLDDLKNLTGAQIKALMIKNGAPQSLLNSVSDDELKQMFLDKINSSASTTP